VCVFRTEAPADQWKLEARVERDDEMIIPKQQRDTVNQRLGWFVRYGLSCRQRRRDQGDRADIGRGIEGELTCTTAFQGHGAGIPYGISAVF
jgi:hypothetical protein